MDIMYVSGSPRKNSNTDYLLEALRSLIGGIFYKLSDYYIEPCRACRDCRGMGKCIIEDDMQKLIIPELLKSDVIILGTPVYFNNVSSHMKKFIDRTYCLMGHLQNKMGGTIVVGRKYGAEGAITAINAFFLKHEMIPVNRGVLGFAFNTGDIKIDSDAIESTKGLGNRIVELGKKLGYQ
ncbi:MAG: flavodoxin family protein [Candidatus Lokiarchaeota archaeon]|nr:flavodoxin family protein [Candidatus Lokiarchaeota archaeon]